MIAGQMFANRSGHHRYFLQPYGLRLEGFFFFFSVFIFVLQRNYVTITVVAQIRFQENPQYHSLGLGFRDRPHRSEHTESLGFSLLLKN